MLVGWEAFSKNAIWHYSNKAGLFFTLCIEEEIRVTMTTNTIHNNPVAYKAEQTKKYIDLLNELK